jgi:hypothetical protein
MPDTILGLPINRFVVFVKPYIDWITAFLAAWLIAKVNVFGIAGLDQSNLQTYLTFGLTTLLVTGLHWLGNRSWIKGHHIELADGAIAIREEEEDLDAALIEAELAPVDTTIPPDEIDRPG